MKSNEGSASTAVGQVERVAAPQRKTETGVQQCLVSSASRTRRNMLSRAAVDAGWDAFVCTTPEDALHEFRRNLFGFALVDLDDRGRTARGSRELLRTLVQDSSRILVGVCGHEADPDEEIWVRQLGAWLYLPGTTTSAEISLICRQALQIVTGQPRKRTSVR